MTTAVLDAVVLDEAWTFAGVADEQAEKTISSASGVTYSFGNADYYFKTVASLKDWPQLSWAVEAPATPKPYVPKPPADREFDLAVVYRKAADLIEEHGWTQGKPVDAAGGRCAGEAIGVAAGVNRHTALVQDQSLYEPFAQWLEGRGAMRSVSMLALATVQNWNDTAGRTKGQVVSALRKFADSIPV